MERLAIEFGEEPEVKEPGMGRVEVFDHTADLGLRVTGSDLDGLGAEDQGHVVALLGRREAGTAIVEVGLAGRI